MLINSDITGKIIKKILRLTVLVVVVMLTALLTLFSILRTPSFQELAGRLAANYLTKQFKTEFFLDRLRISDFLYIEVHGLKVNDNHQKEMIRIDDLRVKINQISLKQHTIEFERVSLDSAGFFLQKYPNDSVVNFDYFLEGFKSDTVVTSDTLVNWNFFCKNLVVNDLTFGYQIRQPEIAPEGIDYNDLLFSEIYLDLKDISIIGDSVAAFIDHIAAREKSGIELLNLSGDAHVSSTGIRVKGAQISTGQSSLDLDLDFLYNGYDKLGYFLDSVRMNADIRSSLVTLSDVGYFAPELFKMDDPVMISGRIEGPISDFSARDLKIKLGEFTEFEGDVAMKGLPYIDSTYFNVDIRSFNTTPEDVSAFNLPLANPNIVLPEQVKMLGFTSLSGYFKGYLDNFNTDLKLYTDAGTIKMTGRMAGQDPEGQMLFSGDILATGLQTGILLSYEDLGMVDLELEFDGRGSSIDSLDISVTGWIQGLEYKKYRYEKILLGGKVLARSFDGRVMVLDPSLNLDFNGLVDFNGEYPAFDFSVNIEKALFFKLNLADRSEDMNLKGMIHGNFKGIDPDSFNGELHIDSMEYVENGVKYDLEHLDLTRVRQAGQPDVTRLRSDYADADITGKFVVKDLVRQLSGFLIGNEADTISNNEIGQNPVYVSFDIKLKDISPLTSLFLPGIDITPNSLIRGKFDSGNQLLEFDGSFDTVTVNGISFEKVNFSGRTAQEDFYLDIGIDHLVFMENTDGTGEGLDNFKLNIHAGNDSINFAINWDNEMPESTNNGTLEGFIKYKSMQDLQAGIYNGHAFFNGNEWRVEKDNLFAIDSSAILIKNFSVYKDDEDFTIDGKLSDRPEDTLNINFEKWSLENFNPLLEGLSLKLAGVINGRFGIFRNKDATNIFAGINISDFSFNDVFFGDAEFKTRWLEADKALAVDLNILSKGTMETPYKILGVNGMYYPFDKKRNFALDIAAQNLNISVLEPLLSSFSSHLAGFATGKLKLSGTNDKPVIIGRLKLARAELKVDYLNVVYSFSNEVEFEENLIKFNDLTVYDPNSNKAQLSGGIKHKYFNDLSLDLTIKPENFIVMDLNRYQNEMFYGKAVATGTVSLTGPFENLSIKVDVKTEKGTKVTIPINYSVDVSQNNFIVFTSTGDSVPVGDNHEVQIEGISIDIGMNVTRNADIEIFLPGNIGNIKATGDGNLRLGVDPYGYLTLNGSYVIQTGLFVFSLEQLVSRRFDILEGSKISWTGDIYDAEVNIVARYRLRTSLDGLGITMLDPEATSQKVIVNTDIRMTGSLFNPDLSFGITFPNLQEQTKQAVYAVLDTNDKGLMNQQAISLLVLGSFSSTGTGGTNPVNPAAIVSSTLSNMLSQISNDFNIGVNYMPGDQVSTEQLEVALSTQLLDDRLIIDGNIDVSGANSSSQKTSSIVGDINVEYKLTPDGRFRVKAFNRSNDLSLYNDYAPYTQGVGVFYRKDFNNLRELFHKSESIRVKKAGK